MGDDSLVQIFGVVVSAIGLVIGPAVVIVVRACEKIEHRLTAIETRCSILCKRG